MVRALAQDLVGKKASQMVFQTEKQLAKMIEFLKTEGLTLLAQEFLMVVLKLKDGNLIYQ